MARLSSKSAERIASLFNSIMVADLMIREGYDRALWTRSAGRAAVELRDKYGINAVGCDAQIEAYEHYDFRRAGLEAHRAEYDAAVAAERSASC